ncbi:MAG: hypothetical protein IPN72_21050 [Saprospiraceae bacterium]|nr:hypothetical protein [Saprospiraceae bacterium]
MSPYQPMNKRITSAFREFILILILFISLPSFILAQALYPVTAILDVQGPYSPVFSTFSDPSNQAFRPNKMALRLRLNDLNEASLAVRLKWEISGPGIEFQTNDDFLGGIANLISGQYITLDNAALTPYFDLFGSSSIDEFVTGTGGYYLRQLQLLRHCIRTNKVNKSAIPLAAKFTSKNTSLLSSIIHRGQLLQLFLKTCRFPGHLDTSAFSQSFIM